MPTAAVRAADRVARPALATLLRPAVSGRGHVPGAGGVLLVANHRSFLDHFLLSAASPRRVRFLGKRELAHGPFGWLNLATGMIPIDRGRADAAAVATVVALLRAGRMVAMFPEGTRSPTGALHRFRGGMARIAADAAVPVVPVGLRGTAHVWPLGAARPARRPGRGDLEVRFGLPLSPCAPDPRARRAFTAAVRDQVAQLCGQPLAPGFAPLPAG